jgi:hypothetical protein
MPCHKKSIQEEFMDYSRCIKTAGRMLRYGFAGALMLMAVPAHAASVSFFLDQSNRLPDDTNYLSVTLDEIAGGVNVLVKTLDPLNSIAGKHLGIRKFAFGLSNDLFEEITGLPDGWNVKQNKPMNDFGRFEFKLEGKGWPRREELSFTVGGVSLGDFDSLFAAKVAGFEWCRDGEWRNRDAGKDCASKAYFAGSLTELPPPNPSAVVPVPAAVWLFGSGLAGLLGLASRRKRNTK